MNKNDTDKFYTRFLVSDVKDKKKTTRAPHVSIIP